MKKDLITSDFYRLPKWLVDIKGLHPVDMLIYCIAYSHRSLSKKNNKVDESGQIYFYLTHEGLKNKLGLGKNQITSSIKRLKKCGVIVAEKKKNKIGEPAKYFLETDINRVKFDITGLNTRSTMEVTSQVPEIIPARSEIGDLVKSDFSDPNKNDILNKNEGSKNEEIRGKLLKTSITPLLKDKLMEYINYRERIGSSIDDYNAIELIIQQIGTTFIDEQHLIDSIDETFMYEYQGIFPAKLKKLTATDKVESTAMKRLRKLREEQNSERGDIS